VVAAALQPGHLWLARWGIPKALAVLLFYCLFFLVNTSDIFCVKGCNPKGHALLEYECTTLLQAGRGL
jgi:hypothetical protein